MKESVNMDSGSWSRNGERQYDSRIEEIKRKYDIKRQDIGQMRGKENQATTVSEHRSKDRIDMATDYPLGRASRQSYKHQQDIVDSRASWMSRAHEAGNIPMTNSSLLMRQSGASINEDSRSRVAPEDAIMRKFRQMKETISHQVSRTTTSDNSRLNYGGNSQIAPKQGLQLRNDNIDKINSKIKHILECLSDQQKIKESRLNDGVDASDSYFRASSKVSTFTGPNEGLSRQDSNYNSASSQITKSTLYRDISFKPAEASRTFESDMRRSITSDAWKKDEYRRKEMQYEQTKQAEKEQDAKQSCRQDGWKKEEHYEHRRDKSEPAARESWKFYPREDRTYSRDLEQYSSKNSNSYNETGLDRELRKSRQAALERQASFRDFKLASFNRVKADTQQAEQSNVRQRKLEERSQFSEISKQGVQRTAYEQEEPQSKRAQELLSNYRAAEVRQSRRVNPRQFEKRTNSVDTGVFKSKLGNYQQKQDSVLDRADEMERKSKKQLEQIRARVDAKLNKYKQEPTGPIFESSQKQGERGVRASMATPKVDIVREKESSGMRCSIGSRSTTNTFDARMRSRSTFDSGKAEPGRNELTLSNGKKLTEEMSRIQQKIQYFEEQKRQLNINFTPFAYSKNKSTKDLLVGCQKKQKSQRKVSDFGCDQTKFGAIELQRQIEEVTQQKKLVSSNGQQVEEYSFEKKQAITKEQKYTEGKKVSDPSQNVEGCQRSEVDFEFRKRTDQGIQNRRKLLLQQPMKKINQNTVKELVSSLCGQAQFDQQLRNCKIWLDTFKTKDSLGKIGQILKDTHGLELTADEIASQFRITDQENNPFFSVQSQGSFSLQELASAYIKSLSHWQGRLLHHFSQQALTNQGFILSRIDLERKGHLQIEDMVRFLNIESGQFFRNRDIVLIWRRVDGKDSLEFGQLMRALCGTQDCNK